MNAVMPNARSPLCFVLLCPPVFSPKSLSLTHPRTHSSTCARSTPSLARERYNHLKMQIDNFAEDRYKARTQPAQTFIIKFGKNNRGHNEPMASPDGYGYRHTCAHIHRHRRICIDTHSCTQQMQQTNSRRLSTPLWPKPTKSGASPPRSHL